jgi:anti-sigma factor RsiW
MRSVDDVFASAMAYVDGCLAPSERRRFEEKLANDAELAAGVEEWRTQSEAIRAAFGESPEGRASRSFRETAVQIQLEPTQEQGAAYKSGPRSGGAIESIRARLQRRSRSGLRRRRLLGGLCSILGGSLLSVLFVAPAPADLTTGLTLAAMTAFRTYCDGSVAPAEATTANVGALEKWLAPQFRREISIPDFRQAGFGLIGGRILPGAHGPIAFALYENTEGARVGVAIEPGETGMALPTETQARDDLRAVAFPGRDSESVTIVGRLNEAAFEDLIDVAEKGATTQR